MLCNDGNFSVSSFFFLVPQKTIEKKGRGEFAVASTAAAAEAL